MRRLYTVSVIQASTIKHARTDLMRTKLKPNHGYSKTLPISDAALTHGLAGKIEKFRPLPELMRLHDLQNSARSRTAKNKYMLLTGQSLECGFGPYSRPGTT